MTSLEMRRNVEDWGKEFLRGVVGILRDQFARLSGRVILTGLIIITAHGSVAAADSVAAFLAGGQFIWNSSDHLKPAIDRNCSCKCELAVETTIGFLDDQETTQVEYFYYGDFTSTYSGSYAVIKNCLFVADPDKKIVTCYGIDATTVSCVSGAPGGNFYIAEETEEGSTISATVRNGTGRLVTTSPSLVLRNIVVGSMDVSPDGRHLAFSCTDKSTGKSMVKSWDFITGAVDDIAPGIGSKFLATKIGIKAEDEKSWTFYTWPELLPHSMMYTKSLTVSPDRSMVVNHTDFNVYDHEHLNSIESGHATWYPLRPFSSSETIISCAFTADGSEMYCHTFGGELTNDKIMNRHKIWQFQFPLTNPDGTVVFKILLPSGETSTCPINNYSALVLF